MQCPANLSLAARPMRDECMRKRVSAVWQDVVGISLSSAHAADGPPVLDAIQHLRRPRSCEPAAHSRMHLVSSTFPEPIEACSVSPAPVEAHAVVKPCGAVHGEKYPVYSLASTAWLAVKIWRAGSRPSRDNSSRLPEGSRQRADDRKTRGKIGPRGIRPRVSASWNCGCRGGFFFLAAFAGLAWLCGSRGHLRLKWNSRWPGLSNFSGTR